MVAIFTKFDAQIIQEYGKLNDVLDSHDRWKMSRKNADNAFYDTCKLPSKGLKCKTSSKIICPTGRYRHQSLFFIQFRGKCYFAGMNNPEKNCPELTMQTANTIDNSTLNHLFISTQMNNLDLCINASLQ